MATEIIIDEGGWRLRGLLFKRNDKEMRFMVDGRSDVCTVHISGDKLMLFPERDSAHRALLHVLTEE